MNLNKIFHTNYFFRVSLFLVLSALPSFGLEFLLEHIDTSNNKILTSAWHPQKNLFATGSFDGDIHIYEFKESKIQLLYTIVRGGNFGHNDKVHSLAWHPLENILLSSSDDNALKLWRMHETFATLIQTLQCNTRGINWLSKGELFVALLENCAFVYNWNKEYAEPKHAWDLNISHSEILKAFALYNSELLATSTSDHTIKLWALNENTPALLDTTFHNPDSRDRHFVNLLSWHPSGQFLASAINHNLKLWKINEGKLIGAQNTHEIATKIVWHPYFRILLSLNNANNVTIWNDSLVASTPINVGEGHITSFSFDHTGKYLLLTIDHTLKIYEFLPSMNKTKSTRSKTHDGDGNVIE